MMELRGVSKAFGERQVLRDFSASFPDGVVTAVTGPSGAGKTTLLRLVLGLLRPDRGCVEGTRGRRFAAVFQEDRLCEQLSAQGNLLLVRPGLEQAELRVHLERVGLGGEEHTRVADMSGGMKRRVAIVRAVIAQADTLTLDEPLHGLDEATRGRVLDYLADGLRGRTVLLVTHEEREALRLGAQHRVEVSNITKL